MSAESPRCFSCGASTEFSHHAKEPVPRGEKLVRRTAAVYKCRNGHETMVSVAKGEKA